MMKTVKIVAGVSLILFSVVISSLLLAGYWNSKYSKDDGSGITNDIVVTTNSEDTQQKLILTAEEVKKHSLPTDCWMIIEGSVYNFTPFLALHPGGADTMTKYCGKDGTTGFATQDKNPSGKHSNTAFKMLPDYLLGKIGDQISVGVKPTTNLIVDSQTPSPVPTTVTPPKVVSISTNTSVNLTLSELSKHNSQTSCWLLISNKVYDVTAYINSHPGGARDILNNCGRDATTAFATQGGGGSHSNFANSLLGNYFIGNLNSTSVVSPSQNTTALTTTVSTNTPSGDPDIPPAIKTKYPGATYVSGKYEDEGDWEGKVTVSGTCRAIKVSGDGVIKEDKSC